MYTFNMLYMRHCRYVHFNIYVNFSDAISLEVGRSWILKTYLLVCV